MIFLSKHKKKRKKVFKGKFFPFAYFQYLRALRKEEKGGWKGEEEAEKKS